MDRTDGTGYCSITVHLQQTQQVSGGGVLFEACRVGSVNDENGSITLYWDMGELSRSRPSVSAEDMTKKLSVFLFGAGEKSGSVQDKEEGVLSSAPVYRAVTGEDGVCIFDSLEEGAWLIHAADSSSYGKVEDALVALPSYVQEEGYWMGPFYSQDIWMKATVDIPVEETNPPQTDPPSSEKQMPELPSPIPETTPETTVQKPSQPVPETAPSPVQETTEQRTPETVPQTTKTPQNETERIPSRPESTTTASPVRTVRTLDDSPLHGLIFLCLCSAIVILVLSVRLGLIQKAIKNRNIKRKLFLALIGTGMLFSSGGSVSVSASDADISSWEASMDRENRIVFVNESPQVPGLTVSKEVLNAENGSRAPGGDSFTFRLKLDQKRASLVKYRLFNDGGIELVCPAIGAAPVEIESFQGTPVAMKTGQDGSFSLTGGQYVLFEDIQVGQLFEVTEDDDPHYERILPMAGDTISGTIQMQGNQAHFTNRYLPPEEGGQEGVLEITKKILWPDGVPLPDQGSFQIRITLDGRALSGANVELSGLSAGSVVEDITTDENGCFWISGNQKAILRDLPAGSDAMVEELEDESDLFVSSSDVIWKGAITSKQKIDFTNRLASFAVTKSVSGEDPDRSFRFTLTGKKDMPMEGAAYYVMGQDGMLSAAEPRMTDAKGQFLLHAGEMAVFAGLKEGTVYSVREEEAFGYRQVTPSSKSGYTNLSIRDGIQTLLFENEETVVRLFAPSAGGPGILLYIAVSALGMIALFTVSFRIRKKS